MVVCAAVTTPPPVTVNVRCLNCHGAVTLQFADWPEDADPKASLRLQEWACPYCKALNLGRFSKRFVWATPWHDPDASPQ